MGTGGRIVYGLHTPISLYEGVVIRHEEAYPWLHVWTLVAVWAAEARAAQCGRAEHDGPLREPHGGRAVHRHPHDEGAPGITACVMLSPLEGGACVDDMHTYGE